MKVKMTGQARNVIGWIASAFGAAAVALVLVATTPDPAHASNYTVSWEEGGPLDCNEDAGTLC